MESALQFPQESVLGESGSLRDPFLICTAILPGYDLTIRVAALVLQINPLR